MTLVETLGGLALLAGILVSLLLAKGNHERQWRLANQRLQAVRAADQLLAFWWQDLPHLPRHGDGDVPGEAEFSWKTRLVDNAAIEDCGARVVRLEIVERDKGHDAPLVAVEVVVPDETPPTTVSSAETR